MTAKFNAFKAALEALCIEHGVTLGTAGYDPAEITVRDADDPDQDDTQDIRDETRGTAEERAAAEAEYRRQRAEMAAAYEAEQQQMIARIEAGLALDIRAEVAGSTYDRLCALVSAIANEGRKKHMRVSTDPKDTAYIDARPRKAWCNDVLIEGWAVADEFRRCVITADGKVLQGSVRIERLSDEAAEVAPAPSVAPIDAGFVGVFVSVPEAKPAEDVFVPQPAAPAEVAPAEVAPAKSAKRRR